MKYLISENKIHSLIIKYLDDKYGELNWRNQEDEYGNETDCGTVFYHGDFYDDEVAFGLYEECWWEEGLESSKEKIEMSPILFFEYNREYNRLNDLFGPMWKPIFKEWFKEKYGFNIKTIFI